MENNDNSEYRFIKEKIVKKNKGRGKKAALVFLAVVVCAFAFGIVARFSFVLSAETVSRILGVEEENPGLKEEVVLAGERNTVTPTATRIPVDDKTEQENSSQNDDEIVSENSEKVTIIEKKIEANLEDYAAVYAELRKLASEVNSSMAQIEATFSEKNWLEEEVTLTVTSTGIVLQDNNVELLILAPYDKLKGADGIEVKLIGGTKYAAQLISYDEDYNLAILGIRLSAIPGQYRRNITYAVFDDLNYVMVGTPVMVLGNLNGYSGAYDFGMITAKGAYTYILDDRLDLFALSCMTSAGSDGIVVNLDGEIIGLLDSSRDTETGAATIVGAARIKRIIESLANNKRIPYFGIVSEEVPESVLGDIGLQCGIYVAEVVSDSPAAKAGIKKGDIISKINNGMVISVAYFNSILNGCTEGDELQIELYRSAILEYKKINVNVKVELKR